MNTIDPLRLRSTLGLAALLLAATLAAAQSVAAPGRMPELTAENLSERSLKLPADLPGERTLVLMAYERRQQADLDTWINALKLKDGAIAWVELPVVGQRIGLMRAFINGGMRRGIAAGPDRDRTVTLFVDAAPLRAAMGLAPQPAEASAVDVVVVSRDGRVLAQASGSYTAAKAGPLLQALQLDSRAAP